MDWLKKLLAAAGLGGTGSNPVGTPPFVEPVTDAGGGTPPFLPKRPEVVGAPLHSAVPDPDQPPFMQTRGQYGTIPTDDPPNKVPGSPPNTVTGNTAVNPFESALATARGDYQRAVAEPAHKQNPWVQALYQGLQLTQRVADPSNPANAQQPKWLGEAKRESRINKAAGTLAPLEAQQERILGERYKKAQTDNIYEDNSRMEAERQDRATRAVNDLKERKRANFYKQNKYFDPSKATPAQKKQLAEIDETPESIGRFDFSKPTFKTVGDTTYKWDANANAFVDSTLPKDPTQAVTEITVKDPETKKVYTFVTSQEKAAQLMNSRTVAGLQIEAARDRQLSQQQFQGSENEKNRNLTRQQDALKAQMQAALKQYDEATANQRQKEAEAAKARLLKLKEDYDALDDDQ